jgi:hypothetical protein
MNSSLTRGLIFGGLGYFIGLSTGVVALGSGVSGTFVFGPIGFVIGWLMPANWTGAEASPFGSLLAARQPSGGDRPGAGPDRLAPADENMLSC